MKRSGKNAERFIWDPRAWACQRNACRPIPLASATIFTAIVS
jgi:hypothetical protein